MVLSEISASSHRSPRLPAPPPRIQQGEMHCTKRHESSTPIGGTPRANANPNPSHHRARPSNLKPHKRNSRLPHHLRAALVIEIVERCAGRRFAQVTRAVRCTTLRRMLRFLWETEGTPKLDEHVPHIGSIRPRCVTASRAQVDQLTRAASGTL